MANLKIAQIQNAALKAAALEVDESGKKDGYIDSSEINLFTDKAIALLNEKKCTAQEFATLFATNEVDNTNTTDVFAKVDSLHNAKNTPEALAKEAEEAKQAEKQEKIKEIKAEIAENDKKLKHYELLLSNKEISVHQYNEDFKPNRDNDMMVNGATSATVGGALLITAMFSEDCLLTVIGGLCGIAGVLAAIGIGIAYKCISYYENKNEHTSKMQEKFRTDYKEAYLKVSQENEQLKAQLVELQKK